MRRKPIDPYKGVGPKPTSEEVLRRKKQRQLLRELGLLPIGWTESDYISDNTLKNDRFSKLYETESQFIEDKLKCLELITDEKEVPEGLYNKVASTVKELSEIYGDKYSYINHV